MGPPSERERGFTGYLEGLATREELGALAALRRGLGKRPGEAAEVYPYVVPWLPASSTRWQEEAYFMIASLFAWHQGSWVVGDAQRGPTNLGASLRRLAQNEDSGSVERRFVGVLNCHRDDLAEHLRRSVALLKSKEVPIDWAQLLGDVCDWDRYDRAVQRAWARGFWRDSGRETEAGSSAAAEQSGNEER